MNDISSLKSRKNIGILVPLVLHLVIVIPLAIYLNIWVDEAYSLHTTDHGFFYAVNQSLRFENQPPLYFAILSLWRYLNGSVLFARLFSVLCMLTTIAVCAPLSRRYLPDRDPRILMMIVALHPYSIWASIEIRLYSMAVCLSALLLLLFFDGYLSPVTQRRARYAYLLVAIAALGTHYFFFCLLMAQLASLFLTQRHWKTVIHHACYLLIAGLCVLPSVPIVLSNHVSLSADTATSESVLLTATSVVLRRITTDLLPLSFVPSDIILGRIMRRGAIALLLLCLIGLSTFHYRKMSLLQQQTTLMLASASGVMVALVILSNTYEGGTRYGFHLFLLSLLWMIETVSFLKIHGPPQRFYRLLTVALIVLFTVSNIVTYTPLAKAGDWRRVSSLLHHRERANQPIFLFLAEGLLPLQHYYRGINSLQALPEPMGEDQYDQRKLVLDEQTLQAIFSGQNPVEQFWLIQSPVSIVESNCSHNNINFNCHVLNQFIDQNYQTVAEYDFFETTVKEMRLRKIR